MKPPETRPLEALPKSPEHEPKVLSGFGREKNRRQRRAMEASRRTRLTAERQKQIRDANKPDKGPENEDADA
ncbi:MAG: hypothetical protein V3U34_00585 [candidate division NC10 bacterium]